MIWTKAKEQQLRNNILLKSYDQLAVMFNATNREIWYKVRAMKLVLPVERVVKSRGSRATVLINQEKNRQYGPGYSIDAITYFGAVRNTLLNGKRGGVKARQIKTKTLNEILRDIAEVFDVDVIDIRRGPRNGELPFYRQLFCLLAKKVYPFKSLKEIGKFIGYRDHSMVFYNIKTIKGALEVKDPATLTMYNRYMEQTKIFKD